LFVLPGFVIFCYFYFYFYFYFVCVFCLATAGYDVFAADGRKSSLAAKPSLPSLETSAMSVYPRGFALFHVAASCMSEFRLAVISKIEILVDGRPPILVYEGLCLFCLVAIAAMVV
jgi:hypothetical protein